MAIAGSVAGTPNLLPPVTAVTPVQAVQRSLPEPPLALPEAPALPDAPTSLPATPLPTRPQPNPDPDLAQVLRHRPTLDELIKSTPMPCGQAHTCLSFVEVPHEPKNDFWTRASNGSMTEDEFIDGLRGKFENAVGHKKAMVVEAAAGLAYVGTGGEISYTLNTARFIPHSRISLAGSIDGSASVSFKLFGDRPR
jgi:hypothetical protein